MVPSAGITSGWKSTSAAFEGMTVGWATEAGAGEIGVSEAGTASGETPAIWAVLAGTPGAAGNADRTSDSAVGSVGIDEGRTGTPGGDCAPGTPGNENMLLIGGNFGAADK